MTHRRTSLGWVLLGAVGAWASIGLSGVAAPAATPDAAGDGPVVTVSVYHRLGLQAGVPIGIYLAVALPPDAPGPPTALLDGLGVAADSFVQRFGVTTVFCQRDQPICGPCPEARVCLASFFNIDVRARLGTNGVNVSVTDARGRVTNARATFDVQPAADLDGDGLPDRWETDYGLRDRSRVGNDGADGDPDGDLVPNLEEFRRGTHPTARYSHYFADGSSGDRGTGLMACFETKFLAQPDQGETGSGGAWITAVGDDGRRMMRSESGADRAGGGCLLWSFNNPADRVVAVTVETIVPMAVDRQSIGAPHPVATPGVAQPSTRWLFADGGTDGPLDTFYLAYNPGPDPVVATFSYAPGGDQPVRRRVRELAPGRRTTIWVNVDDAFVGRAATSTEITATGPILVERAWRHDPPGRTVTQQYASPGTPEPSSRWFFPDVDGGSFDTSIAIFNPAATEALLDLSFLYDDRPERRNGRLRIPAGGRATIPAARLEGLSGARASVEIVAANGVRVAADRTVGGQDGQGPWRFAAVGAREPGVRWVLARTALDAEVVIANVSAFPAKVELHFALGDPEYSDVVNVVEIPARRRLVYPLSSRPTARFPWAGGTLRITSQPTDRGVAGIVAEHLTYSTVDGIERSRATGLLLTRVP